ncbi:hypothetical protein B8W98_07925, partial [Lentilactobacillus parakefiri]
MKNDCISKWKLFITSYLPLYLWLLLSNINYNKLGVNKYSHFHSVNVYKLIAGLKSIFETDFKRHSEPR